MSGVPSRASPSPACPALQVQTDGADVEVPDKGLQTYEPEDALNAALDALQNEMQEMESSFAVGLPVLRGCEEFACPL